MLRTVSFGLLAMLMATATPGLAIATEPLGPARLSPRNTEVPFAYLADGTRRWPIVVGSLARADRLGLELRRDKQVVASGERVELDGISARVDRTGQLVVTATPAATARLTLHLVLTRDKSDSRQAITLQKSPPPRPISYISDLVDDLIRIFWDSKARRFRPVTRDAFDQYFRRLQCQGVARLIVWPGPFPTLADPANYPAADWRRFESCTRAILDNKALTTSFQAQPGQPSWRWLRFLMKLRLDPSIMTAYATSAHDKVLRGTSLRGRRPVPGRVPAAVLTGNDVPPRRGGLRRLR